MSIVVTQFQALRFDMDQVAPEHCNQTCPYDSGHICGGPEMEISLYRTILLDPRCEKVSMGAPGQFKMIMLASFPGSGNTWARYMFERATGFYTGKLIPLKSTFFKV